MQLKQSVKYLQLCRLFIYNHNITYHSLARLQHIFYDVFSRLNVNLVFIVLPYWEGHTV